MEKKSSPGDTASPRDFGGVASKPGIGVTGGGFGRWGWRRSQRFGEVLLRGERVLTGHPVLIELLHTLLAHLFSLAIKKLVHLFTHRFKKTRKLNVQVAFKH